MSRALACRYLLEGELVALTPLHVGAAGPGLGSDLPLAVTGAGTPYIPGTSLAGPLRHWCESAFGETIAKALFGWQPPPGVNREGHASFLLVKDAIVEGTLSEELRDHVGIDRSTGAAAKGIKYDRAILPKGTRLTFRLVAEAPRDSRNGGCDAATTGWIVAQMAQALKLGEIRLGGAKSRGLGKVKLEKPQLSCEQLDSAEGILSALDRRLGRAAAPEVRPEKPDELSDPQPRSRLTITVRWERELPVMVKAPLAGIGVDMLPLVSGVGAGLCAVLPGSGIKGALRFQAERILRTVLGTPPRGGDFLDQIAGMAPIDALFGAAKAREGTGEKGRLGALSVDDVYATQALTREQHAAIADAPDVKDVRQALERTDWSEGEAAMHVAIDRWTGGAADGFLFGAVEPVGLAWGDIVMELDLDRLRRGSEWAGAGLALLLLTLRDLAGGEIPLGFGANRGYGSIAVTGIEITGDGLGEEDRWLEGLIIRPGGFKPGDDAQARGLARVEGYWHGLITQCGKP